MRVLYFDLMESDIVLCDGPAGSAVFWSKSKHTVLCGWKSLEIRRDFSPPLCRIVAVQDEVEATIKAETSALLRVARKLPLSRKNRGVMGVMRRPVYTWEGKQYRGIGFFHVPSIKKWNDLQPGCGSMLDMGTAPEGYPNRIRI